LKPFVDFLCITPLFKLYHKTGDYTTPSGAGYWPYGNFKQLLRMCGFYSKIDLLEDFAKIHSGRR